MIVKRTRFVFKSLVNLLIDEYNVNSYVGQYNTWCIQLFYPSVLIVTELNYHFELVGIYTRLSIL